MDEPRKSTQTISRHTDVVVTVTLGEGPSTETLTCSREHPFYLRGVGFVPAGGLKTGEHVETANGHDLVVQSVTWHRKPSDYSVYNGAIEVDHTYFVGRLGGGAWVHRPNFGRLNPRLTSG